jgi:hypothetical protein
MTEKMDSRFRLPVQARQTGENDKKRMLLAMTEGILFFLIIFCLT